MSLHCADVTAAILAGGEGCRVGGRDKGLLILAGEPLIAHVIAVLREQVGANVICANRNTGEYARFAPVLADEQPGFQGPLAGIASALAHCATPWLLTVPVDCPRPPADLARRLYDCCRQKNVSIAVAHDGARRQPLFALYRRELATVAAQALARNVAVWRWQDEAEAIEVDFSTDRHAFANLNSDAEFLLWEQSPP